MSTGAGAGAGAGAVDGSVGGQGAALDGSGPVIGVAAADVGAKGPGASLKVTREVLTGVVEAGDHVVAEMDVYLAQGLAEQLYAVPVLQRCLQHPYATQAHSLHLLAARCFRCCVLRLVSSTLHPCCREDQRG